MEIIAKMILAINVNNVSAADIMLRNLKKADTLILIFSVSAFLII